MATANGVDGGPLSGPGDSGKKLLDHNGLQDCHVDVRRQGPPWWRSQRYVLGYVIFWGMMNIFCQRINFSVAILCMVNHTAVSSGHHLTDGSRNRSSIRGELTVAGYNNNNTRVGAGHDLPSDNVPGQMTNGTPDFDLLNMCDPVVKMETNSKEDGPFVWDKTTQGTLLGAVYWSYLAVQIPGNLLVRKVKKKSVILASMALMTLCTMVAHGAALVSPWAIFCVRLVQGGCTALAIIAMYGIWSKWAPPGERSGLLSLSVAGQMMGNVVVFPVSGLLCKYGFLGGWPSVFYVFGFISLAWLLVFYLLSDDSPEHHKYISVHERNYIMLSLKEMERVKQQGRPPWLSILKSAPVWGIVTAHVSYTWGLFLFLSTLPQYMYEVLKFDIKSNGIFSMLGFCIGLMLTTWYRAKGRATHLSGRKFSRCPWSGSCLFYFEFGYKSTKKVHKCITDCIPALALICLSFLDCQHRELAITLLVCSVGATGFGLSAFVTNPFDIAPVFASEIMIISNTVATIPGILTPIVVATVTRNQTREEWQIVLFLTSAIYICGAAGFCVLARADVQNWAKQTTNDLDLQVLESHNMTEEKQNGGQIDNLIQNKL
ncbi:hypothetical protein Btru_057319 [Bulinus truncatus]|nr:hypothetical protein Btru_057319 [Bulinus truncatus]